MKWRVYRMNSVLHCDFRTGWTWEDVLDQYIVEDQFSQWLSHFTLSLSISHYSLPCSRRAFRVSLPHIRYSTTLCLRIAAGSEASSPVTSGIIMRYYLFNSYVWLAILCHGVLVSFPFASWTNAPTWSIPLREKYQVSPQLKYIFVYISLLCSKIYDPGSKDPGRKRAIHFMHFSPDTFNFSSFQVWQYVICPLTLIMAATIWI
jgi:hypothetical protein